MLKFIIEKLSSKSKDPRKIIEDSLRDLNETIPKVNEEISSLKQKAVKAKSLVTSKEDEYTKSVLRLESLKKSDSKKISSAKKKMDSLDKDIATLRQRAFELSSHYGAALDSRDEFISTIYNKMDEAHERVLDQNDSQFQYASILERLNQISETAKDNTLDEANDPVMVLEGLLRSLKNPVKANVKEIIEFSHKILDDVACHPDHANRCRMFLNFYLDSTVNIVKGYIEFKELSVTSDTIQESLSKAEELLLSVKKAFEHLLIKLAEDEVMNLDTELTVLEKTLRYEGL